jgi:hypothetical protein
VSSKTTDKGMKRDAKSDKRGPKRWPQRVMVTTSYDDGDNDKDVGNSNEEFITVAEHDFHAPGVAAC